MSILEKKIAGQNSGTFWHSKWWRFVTSAPVSKWLAIGFLIPASRKNIASLGKIDDTFSRQNKSVKTLP